MANCGSNMHFHIFCVSSWYDNINITKHDECSYGRLVIFKTYFYYYLKIWQLIAQLSLNHTDINVIVGIPQNVNFSVAKDTFLRVPGIVTVHNLRIWGLTTDKTALSAHLVIGKLKVSAWYRLTSNQYSDRVFPIRAKLKKS